MTNCSAKTRAWTFEKKTRGPWIGSLEPQRDRYWAAVDRPTCRNRGPKGRKLGGGDWVTTFRVVRPAVDVPAGLVLPSGLVVPDTGATLNAVPLAPLVFSVRQAKRLQRRLLTRFPDAAIIKSCGTPECQRRLGPSVSAPGAPLNWWDVRAPERAPRMSWKQFAALVDGLPQDDGDFLEQAYV